MARSKLPKQECRHSESGSRTRWLAFVFIIKTTLDFNTRIGRRAACGLMSRFLIGMRTITEKMAAKNNMPVAPAPIRTLIIDDEPHARNYLRELLDGETDVLIVGEASSGAEGLDLIRDISPDLVFLDV